MKYIVNSQSNRVVFKFATYRMAGGAHGHAKRKGWTAMIKTVALYPEYLPADKLEFALKQARVGGVEAVRFGEFAWGIIEPCEGHFDWQVFDRAFELCEKLGLKVILGTPTACPPIWLAQAHPDILPVNEQGQTIGFGSRQHRCYNAPAFRAAAGRVVAAMARRYGNHKALLAWQIDNELAAEHKYCYCDTCKQKYQQYLADKYGTIEALNQRLMTTFWAQNYSDFSQIELPRPVQAYFPVRPHPSLMFEYLRFSSQSVVDFTNEQTKVIRGHSGKPLTTNQDSFFLGDNVDLAAIFENLDIAGVDVYTNELYEAGFYFDLFRCIKDKPFWLLEFGAQSPMLKDALDLAAQKGCGLTGLFAYHPFPAGQEQLRFSLVDHFWNPQPNYAIFRDWTPPDRGAQERKVCLHYDFDSSWAYNVENDKAWHTGMERIFSRLAYPKYLIHTVYKALYDNNLAIDIRTRPQAPDTDTPLILPMHVIYNRAMEEKLLAFVEAGGLAIVTDDLFLKNQDNAYLTEMPELYRRLMGANAAYLDNAGGAGFREFALGRGVVRFVNTATDCGGWDALLKDGLLDR